MSSHASKTAEFVPKRKLGKLLPINEILSVRLSININAGTTAKMFNELLNDCEFLLAHVNSELIVEPHMGLGSSIILHDSLGFAHGLDPVSYTHLTLPTN